MASWNAGFQPDYCGQLVYLSSCVSTAFVNYSIQYHLCLRKL